MVVTHQSNQRRDRHWETREEVKGPFLGQGHFTIITVTASSNRKGKNQKEKKKTKLAVLLKRLKDEDKFEKINAES